MLESGLTMCGRVFWLYFSPVTKTLAKENVCLAQLTEVQVVRK
jgi:hypothetical protein